MEHGLVIDTTGKSLTIELSGAVSATQPTFSVDGHDYKGRPFNLHGATNNTSEVDVVPNPAEAGDVKIVTHLLVYNGDSASVTIQIELEDTDASVERILWKRTLAVGETWEWWAG